MFKNEIKEGFELKASATVDFNVAKADNGTDLMLTNEEVYPGVRVLVRDADISDGKVKIIATLFISVEGVFAYSRFEVKKNVAREKTPMFIENVQRYNRGYNGEEGGGFSDAARLNAQFKRDLVAKLETLLDIGEVQELAVTTNEVDLAEELGDVSKGKGKKGK